MQNLNNQKISTTNFSPSSKISQCPNEMPSHNKKDGDGRSGSVAWCQEGESKQHVKAPQSVRFYTQNRNNTSPNNNDHRNNGPRISSNTSMQASRPTGKEKKDPDDQDANNEDNDDNDDDDMMLYDDLADTKIANSSSGGCNTLPTTTFAKTDNHSVAITRTNHHPKSFSQQVEELQRQVDSTQSENQRLKRNIGTLFRTARSEIQRKDAEIARLMEALDKAQQPQQHQQQPPRR